MGSCAPSSASQQGRGGSTDERNLSSAIARDLRKDKEDVIKVKKILFLGTGGSGKSTIFKQLRQIHGEGFKDSDKEEFIKHIHFQCVNQMQKVLQCYVDWNHRKQQRESKENGDGIDDDTYDELSIWDDLTLSSPPISKYNIESANTLRDYSYNKQRGILQSNIASCIISLWKEPVIKEIYNKRNITMIEDSSAHFWDKMDDIDDSNYLPSTHDIFLCRLPTTGLHEMCFEIKSDIFNIIDVGGQRSQRRKWIHCFEYVVAVIFISSLSSYDEILYESPTENAMEDQIMLFDDVCNNQSLSSTAMILFLNKKDLFQQKHCMDKIPLNKCPVFDNYDAECFEFEKGTKYISEEFCKLNKTPATREIFCHLTCATDTDNISKVFADVQLVVISNALSEGGYMDFDSD